jgi:hypothetical protein
MKFIHYLDSIAGVSIYPLLTLLLFFGFFVFLLVYVMSRKKETYDEISHLPLDDFETK